MAPPALARLDRIGVLGRGIVTAGGVSRAEVYRAVCLLLLLALSATGCGWFSPPERAAPDRDRPEQRSFKMEPGSGAGPLANEFASTLGSGSFELGSANHFATVETITDRIFLVGFRSSENDEEECVGYVGNDVASVVCGLGDYVDLTNDHSGWSSDGIWVARLVWGPRDTTLMELSAEDGTKYTVETHERWGYVEWPAERGRITEIVAFDAEGEVLQRIEE